MNIFLISNRSIEEPEILCLGIKLMIYEILNNKLRNNVNNQS